MIFDDGHANKANARRAAMMEFRNLLPETVGSKIHRLWEAFEACETMESRIANALDKLEAQIQHNEADLSTWLAWEKRRVFCGLLETGPCHPSLSTLTESIVQEAAEKISTTK
jgi:putative hydrolase of HD superfamily